MKNLVMFAKWVLIVGGLLWAYEGITNTDFTEQLLGSLEPIVDVVVFGGSALILAYHLLTMKSKRK